MRVAVVPGRDVTLAAGFAEISRMDFELHLSLFLYELFGHDFEA